MTPRERLQNVQDRLVARGVTDIKFAWAENVHTKSLDQVCEDVATALEAYLDGKCHPLPPAGDSLRV